jgi:hypothetical protein
MIGFVSTEIVIIFVLTNRLLGTNKSSQVAGFICSSVAYYIILMSFITKFLE